MRTGQENSELAAPPGPLAADRKSSAMQLDELTRDRKSNSQAPRATG